MRLTAVSLLTLCLASAAIADLQPGYVVRSGDPFPIVADFNGDGLDDLFQDDVVILNDGATLAQEHSLGLLAGEEVIGVLDVNADGRLDLLVQGAVAPPMPAIVQPQPAAQGAVYKLYIADESRQYANPIFISRVDRPFVADADGDGKDDILVMADVWLGNGTVTDVTVLRSAGDGTFDRLETFRIPHAQVAPDYRVQSGDVDSDGKLDLVIRAVDDIVILHGTGGGRFRIETRHMPMNREFGRQTWRLADIDGDSHLDIAFAGFRSIRVLYGDGRGKFPRSTRTMISRVHDPVGLPLGLVLQPDQANQPRNIAVGNFTRRDRNQIAAGTGEGDLVVYEYDRGALREVSRTFTEFWLLDIRPGAFRRTGGDDIYVIGALIWGDVWPKPRLFGADSVVATAAPARTATRGRAVNRTLPDTGLRIQFQGDCINAGLSERWLFSRDGVFGLARRDQTSMEALFEGSQVYLRMNVPFAKEPVRAELTEVDGIYTGTANVVTDCGVKTMAVTAKTE